MKFYIVDAFTNTLFGGNPAGVVLLDKGADFPYAELMRRTAAELRYSETAFIKEIGSNHFQLRYFTSKAEVDLCGHATIASFTVLKEEGLAQMDVPCVCSTLAGDLSVLVSKSCVLMEMGAPEALKTITCSTRQRELYEVMGISTQSQVEFQTKNGRVIHLSPEIISTGLLDIILPVQSEADLAAIAPDYDALSRLSEKYGVVGVHAFTLNTDEGVVYCRNFAPLYDINEEAATGTANGALTYYLYKNGLLSGKDEVHIVQGEAMGRPSAISSRLSVCGGEIKIQVGGNGVILAYGTINL